MIFNLDFANNTILSCFFLTIDLYFLIQLLLHIFNLSAELVIPIGIPTKEVKAEMKTHPVTAETKISKRAI